VIYGFDEQRIETTENVIHDFALIGCPERSFSEREIIRHPEYA
jgi:hypothetical protein